MCVWGGSRGGGGTLIFSYMRTGFQKNEYFWGGGEDFVDNFGGHHNNGLYLGVISMHFRVFS